MRKWLKYVRKEDIPLDFEKTVRSLSLIGSILCPSNPIRRPLPCVEYASDVG